MRSSLFRITAILASLSCGCRPFDDAPDDAQPTAQTSPTVGDVARHYKQLKLMTPSPVFVNPEIAVLCRGASQGDVEKARKTAGIHAHTQVRIYMNAAAAEVFAKRQDSSSTDSKRIYPVGSIIVKEKTGQAYDVPSGKPASTPDGMGGMIKRPAGYDPAHSDWEYFYFQDAAKIESGRIASCVRCHAAAAERDYVFGSWSKGG